MRSHRSGLRAAAVLTVALLGAALACNGSPPSPPTEAPPEILLPSPTVPALPTVEPPAVPEPPAPPPGWLTYTNTMLGYAFDYPAEAELVGVGVTGYPTDELPAGVEPGDYVPTLEAAYPEALCAGLRYGTAYLYVGAPEGLGGRYSLPCGVSGVGNYDLRPVEEPVTIGPDTLNAPGSAIHSLDDGTFLYEFFVVRERDFRFNYGGDWTQAATTYETYLTDKAIIQQVLASWRWLE
jgi:hypothetical protein